MACPNSTAGARASGISVFMLAASTSQDKGAISPDFGANLARENVWGTGDLITWSVRSNLHFLGRLHLLKLDQKCQVVNRLNSTADQQRPSERRKR